MNKKIKEKWIRALRSGRYRQGKGVLRRRNDDGSLEYCCLGVLCNIYAKDKGEKWEEGAIGISSMMGDDYLLPPEVMKWAGLEIDNPEARNGYGNMCPLSHLNDNDVTFPEIADLIEEQL